MAEIKKIYRGMQNGAETIDENFKTITTSLQEQVKRVDSINTGKWMDVELSGAFSGDQPIYLVDRGLYVTVRLNNITNNNALTTNSPYNIILLPESVRPKKQQEKSIIFRMAGDYIPGRLILATNGYLSVTCQKQVPINTSFGITETFVLI